MSETQDSPEDTNRFSNENGRLYLWGGVISAIISLFIVPLFGLIAVYCGYKLYVDEQRAVPAVLIAGSGAFGFLFWLFYLTTL